MSVSEAALRRDRLIVVAALLTLAALAYRPQPLPPGGRRRRFAIIVPAHNEELLIGEMLESVARQAYPSSHYTVHVIADNMGSILPHVKAGRVKMLAVNTLKRSSYAPDVPTVAEVTGLRDFDYPPLIGIWAPARTPRIVIGRLADGVTSAVQHPEVMQRFSVLGIDPVGSTPEAYAAQTRIDIEKYARAVKAAGVKVD